MKANLSIVVLVKLLDHFKPSLRFCIFAACFLILCAVELVDGLVNNHGSHVLDLLILLLLLPFLRNVLNPNLLRLLGFKVRQLFFRWSWKCKLELRKVNGAIVVFVKQCEGLLDVFRASHVLVVTSGCNEF